MTTVNQHIYDEDGTCVICGFDGAEFHWWKNSTYEGKASPEVKAPICKDKDSADWNSIYDRVNDFGEEW